MPPELLRCESLPFGARSFDGWIVLQSGRNRNSWCAVSSKEKVVANIFEPLLLARTETDGCAMSVTPVPG